jgi:uncharacterized protein DUF6328
VFAAVRLVAKREPLGPKEKVDLRGSLTQILEEARTTLPGVQAIFGFQLIAAFNQGFWEKLPQTDKQLHLLALLLVALAAALLITPAAYHR